MNLEEKDNHDSQSVCFSLQDIHLPGNPIEAVEGSRKERTKIKIKDCGRSSFARTNSGCPRVSVQKMTIEVAKEMVRRVAKL